MSPSAPRAGPPTITGRRAGLSGPAIIGIVVVIVVLILALILFLLWKRRQGVKEIGVEKNRLTRNVLQYEARA